MSADTSEPWVLPLDARRKRSSRRWLMVGIVLLVHALPTAILPAPTIRRLASAVELSLTGTDIEALRYVSWSLVGLGFVLLLIAGHRYASGGRTVIDPTRRVVRRHSGEEWQFDDVLAVRVESDKRVFRSSKSTRTWLETSIGVILSDEEWADDYARAISRARDSPGDGGARRALRHETSALEDDLAFGEWRLTSDDDEIRAWQNARTLAKLCDVPLIDATGVETAESLPGELDRSILDRDDLVAPASIADAPSALDVIEDEARLVVRWWPSGFGDRIFVVIFLAAVLLPLLLLAVVMEGTVGWLVVGGPLIGIALMSFLTSRGYGPNELVVDVDAVRHRTWFPWPRTEELAWDDVLAIRVDDEYRPSLDFVGAESIVHCDMDPNIAVWARRRIEGHVVESVLPRRRSGRPPATDGGSPTSTDGKPEEEADR